MRENRWIAWVRRLRQGRQRVTSRAVGVPMTWLRRREPRILQITAVTRRFARTTIVQVLAALHVHRSQRLGSRVLVMKHAPRVAERVRPAVPPPARILFVPRVQAAPSVPTATADSRVGSPGYARVVHVPEAAHQLAAPQFFRTRSGMAVRSRLRRISPLRAEPVFRMRRVATRQEQMPADRPSLLMRAPGHAPARQPIALPAHTSFEPRARQEQAAWSAVAMPGVDALTDEVIRQIDRRVIAQRERLGRV
jgi:hypothetical protein